jgi:rod shape-determining protein MreD
MKTVRSIAIAVILLYLQVLVISPVNGTAIIPNLLIGYIVFQSMYLGKSSALLIAFFIGLALDLVTPFTLGVNCLIFLLLTQVVYATHSLIDKEKFTNNITAIVGVNFLFYVITYIAFSIADSFSANMIWLFVINVILNSIITFIITYILIFIHKLKITFDEDFS